MPLIFSPTRALRRPSRQMPGFFADECVARLIVEGLASRGFDILDAKIICQGEDDERVLSIAAAAGRIVITDDWGFGEMTLRHRKPAAGVVILSLYALSAGVREAYAIERIVENAKKMNGYLTIIEPGRIRTRPLLGP
jgi:predicted nuclease of predicted toxin-antitoxin system